MFGHNDADSIPCQRGTEVSNDIKDTRWKKGQSGNPKGRPKGIRSSISDYRNAGDEIAIDTTGETYHQVAARKAWREAAFNRSPKVRLAYMSFLADRIFGKPVQSVLTGNIELTREQRIAHLEELLSTLPETNDERSGDNSKPN